MESIKNRNNSYFSIVHKLPRKLQLIYQIISEHDGISAQQISSKYMIPINEITGCITELKERCLIVECEGVENQYSKKLNTPYKAIKSRTEIVIRINLRYAELINEKDALINDYLKGLSPYGRRLLDREVERKKNKIHVLEQILDILN